jgi:cytochrome c-type biogenesis protein CcmH
MNKWFAAVLFSGCAWAIDPIDFASPAEEARFHDLAAELRCLVCQNESLADSSAPLAQDLRRVVKAQMDQGKSNPEIKAYLTERYGAFVLYRPPFDTTNALLWLAPFAVLLLGGWFAFRALSAHRQIDAATDPDAATLAARLRAERDQEL